jgi:hypothetical protein
MFIFDLIRDKKITEPASESQLRITRLLSTVLFAMLIAFDPMHDAPFLFANSISFHTHPVSSLIVIPVLVGFIIMNGLLTSLFQIRINQSTKDFVFNISLIIFGLIGTIAFLYRCLYFNW